LQQTIPIARLDLYICRSSCLNLCGGHNQVLYVHTLQDSIAWALHTKNYERLLFIINIFCNHVCIKLFVSLVQWLSYL